MGHKVLLLEQAQSIGGLTHSFSRGGFSWDVGLHYCGTFGHDQPAGRILDWLSGGAIEFHSVGTVYDILHFPEDFQIPVARPADWKAFKQNVKARMMEFFRSCFPALDPFIVYWELGAPLATASFTGHENSGFYGVETTPSRSLSEALNAQTPVPGLYLTGQEVMMPGIAGALRGGMLGAAAIDARVFQKFR